MPEEPLDVTQDTRSISAQDQKELRARWVERRMFEPDEIAGKRFRILRFIGKGGMGEVYEAEDLELGGRLALKTLRSEVAADKETVARFKQEIQLARKVTHPNVCRIFDLARHTPESGEPVTFLTMELLEGETLSQRLRRQGPLTPAEALPIITQIAAGLNAAHEAGVVHRDFKSSNVMLNQRESGSGSPRAVVTDFGLARSVHDENTAAGVPAGYLFGTPRYMAPEQLRGEPATTASDIYAFGIVIYEAITGAHPFPADTPVQSAVKRLHEAPETPRKKLPHLNATWEAAILRCLERDPSDRFRKTTEVIEALNTACPPPVRKRWWNTRRGLTVALAALGLVVAGAGVYQMVARRHGDATPDIRPVSARRSVAVRGFEDLSRQPESAWLSTALAEMLTTELAMGESLRLIRGAVETQLAADVIISGSFAAIGQSPSRQIRVDVRVQDGRSGELLTAIAETGREENLFDLVTRIGASVRQKLGVAGERPSDPSVLRASMPANPEAARLYSEGLDALRKFDAVKARSLLEQAVAADPKHAGTHAALAEAWSALGHDPKAVAEARTAFERSSALSREERLSIEGRYYEMARDWERAIDTYRRLFVAFPDQVSHGLRLAGAQNSGGKPRDALRTIEDLRKMAPPAPSDPRIDLEEATAANRLADFKRQLAAAERAGAKAREAGMQQMLARAQLAEGTALLNVVNPERARAVFEEARRTFEAAGDRGGAARALANVGTALFNQGDLEGARKVFDESAAISREIGDEKALANTCLNLGAVALDQARLAEATQWLRQALTVSERIGYTVVAGMALNNLGNAFLDEGNFSEARKYFEKALIVKRELGDKSSIGTTLMNLAETYQQQGDLRQASQGLDEALALAEQTENKRLGAYALASMGAVRLASGDVAGAQERYQQALESRRQQGNRLGAAQVRLQIASLLLEVGKFSEGEAEARAALEEMRAQKAAADEAGALNALSRCLLAQKRLAEARTASEQATAKVTQAGDHVERLTVAIQAARVAAASGSVSSALEKLSQVESEATRRGLLPLRLEASLALGEIELGNGKMENGRVRLAAVETEAKRAGYHLIAHKAASALGQS